MSGDIVAFDRALTRLNQDDRIPLFLSQLDSDPIIQNIPKSHAESIVNALLDNGDLFPIGKNDALNLSTAMRIHRIIHGLLTKNTIPSKIVFLILQKAISTASKSIYISVHELEEQSREHNEDESTFLPSEYRDSQLKN